MENYKTKRLFLLLLMTALCMLILFIFFNSSSRDSVKKSYNYSLMNRKSIQMVYGMFFDVLVDKEGNAYLTTHLNNIETFNDEKLKNRLQKIISQFSNYFPQGYTNNAQNNLNAYKLSTEKVLSVYYVYSSLKGENYFVFIKENGTLAYMSDNDLTYNSIINIKNIDKLENVVTVIKNDYNFSPYVVTIDGQEYYLDEYLE